MMASETSRPRMSLRRYLLMAAPLVVLHLLTVLAPWGLDDIAGYLSEPARYAMLVVMLVTALVSPFWVPVDSLNKGRREKFSADRLREGRLPLALLGIVMWLVYVVPQFCDRREIVLLPGDLWRWPGVAMAAMGNFLALWAPAHLGRNFSAYVTIQEGHTLVTDGPFAVVRHPRYLGIIVFSIGYSMVHRSALGLALALVLAVALVSRLKAEEALLAEHFGEAWDSYAKRTKRLIPGVW